MLKFLNKIESPYIANTLALFFSFSALLGIIGIYKESFLSENLYVCARLFFECFSGVAIVYLWLNIERRRSKKQEKDLGLIALASAILIWSIGDNFKIWNYNSSLLHNCISTLNSLCFLYSIKYLDLKEGTALQRLSRFFRSPWLKKDVTLVIITGIVLIANIGFCWYFQDKTSPLSLGDYSTIHLSGIAFPDFILSLFTIWALLYFFNKVFKERGLEQFLPLILLTVSVTLIVQLWGFIHETTHIDPSDKVLIKVELGIVIIKAIYRSLLIVLFFLLAASWLFRGEDDRRKEAEKQRKIAENQRKDMNHAIRGTLNLLSDDLERQINEVKYDDNKYATFLALNDIKIRSDAMYNLHNSIHRERGEGVELKPLISQCLNNIKEGLNYDKMPLNGHETLSDFKCNRVNAQKIMGILLELAINANKVASKLINDGDKRLKREGKKLNISLKEEGANLVIIVGDNGKPYVEKSNEGHGLKQVKRTVIGDWKGSINYYGNDMNVTTCVITIPLLNIKTN